MKLIEVQKSNEFEYAHKCECGALFVANEKDLFIEQNGNLLCDFSVKTVCPCCNQEISINATGLPQQVLRSLLDVYIDEIPLKKREK